MPLAVELQSGHLHLIFSITIRSDSFINLFHDFINLFHDSINFSHDLARLLLRDNLPRLGRGLLPFLGEDGRAKPKHPGIIDLYARVMRYTIEFQATKFELGPGSFHRHLNCIRSRQRRMKIPHILAGPRG